MPIPIVCVDSGLRQFAASFRPYFSKPQSKYFVIVLLGMLLCQGRHTLTGLLQPVSEPASVSGLSRFLSEAPWSATAVAGEWQSQFYSEMAPLVQAEHRRQRQQRAKRPGRPKRTLVTGYLIGDDSTMHKVKGEKMDGLGKHHSTTLDKRVPGHSLVQSLYVVLGRRCPLLPQMYRQKAVCEREGVPFQSKVEMMRQTILSFEPLAGTVTHVLLDTWYTAKALWQAARQRGFLITSGLKGNRWLRIEDESAPNGWRWQRLDAYAATLPPTAYTRVLWPSQAGEHVVYAHVITTRVRKLYRCQVIIVRNSLTAPIPQARFWASSDLEADLATLIHHMAMRWQIEVLFADAKEELGIDHYQLLDATAILRFWTLALLVYYFLDRQRHRWRQPDQPLLTIGETRRELQRLHQQHFLDWLFEQFRSGAQAAHLFRQLTATLA
jgi:hypothetical protein